MVIGYVMIMYHGGTYFIGCPWTSARVFGFRLEAGHLDSRSIRCKLDNLITVNGAFDSNKKKKENLRLCLNG